MKALEFINALAPERNIPNGTTRIRLLNASGDIHHRTAPGDLILEWGEPVKQWPAEQAKAAFAELGKHRCAYYIEDGFAGKFAYGDEWALDFVTVDENGDEEMLIYLEPAAEDEDHRWNDIPAWVKKG